jgi:dolichol-phosphate mannosyltransferase
MHGTRPQISVAVPVYNEIEVLPQLYERVARVLDGLGVTWELVLADDGSTDGTREWIAEQGARDRRLKAVLLSRNFGQGAARLASLAYAGGEWTVSMDADLQDEPEAIPRMLERAREGHEVVYAVRTKRNERWTMRLATAAFYRIAGRFSEVPQPRQVGAFSLIGRRALDHLLDLPERNTYIPGLRSFVGFSQAGVELERSARSGRSRVPIGARIVYGLDGLFAFSDAPLRIATWLGVAAAAFAALLAVSFAVLRVVADVFVPGVTAVLTVALFLGGFQLITLGLIGEYLGRVYREVKRRPRYVAEERLNLEAPAEPG